MANELKPWYYRHRMEWIAEMLHVYGFINREHIERKFGLSTPQASKDLNDFQKLNPKIAQYSLTRKRYEAVSRGGDK
jgi:hypothetical protein